MDAPPLRLFNTESQRTEALDLTRPVSLYVCGVTPYDTTHLGHAFTYLSFDLLVRFLRFLGAEVRYIQNVTDIDDDILLRAHAVGKDWQQLGREETEKFLQDMTRLNWRPPEMVKATDHIPQMLAIIQQLCERGCAYVAGGSVYFDVKQQPRFGRRLVDLTYDAALELANERGNLPTDPNKRDPLDFVLWQKAKEDEPSWESQWGAGRPGWHIECSAMCMAHLGTPLTIHGGGADLRFPHHEAEICQSEHASGERFVEHWMHTAMVYAGEKKMSKSLGNMVFVRDLLQRYSPDAIRLYLLSHHYREVWEYDDAAMDEYRRMAQGLVADLAQGGASATREEALAEAPEVIASLADDLNGPAALGALTMLAGRAGRPRAAARLLATQVFGLTLEATPA